VRLKLIGKQQVNGKVYDRSIGADCEEYWGAGALMVAELLPELMGYMMPLDFGATWTYVTTGGLIRKIELFNPTAGAITFRLAMKSTTTGAPDVQDAILAWDTPLAAGAAWRWNGEMPLNNHLYARVSAGGCSIYYESEGID
jgi:hypothetical protein